MAKYSIKNFGKGIEFVKNNPQLIYTLFLIVIIPVALIFNGQKFLSVSNANQDRMEKERIGILQDVFSQFATLHLEDSGFLQNRIEDIVALNPSIKDFSISKIEHDNFRIIASLDITEVGQINTDPKELGMFQTADTDKSFIFRLPDEQGIRHLYAVRGINNRAGLKEAVLFTDISMEDFDYTMAKNIRSAYYYLIFIILAVVLLLIRHTKIIDYTALYKKLKSVDQMKDDFISMAAHELRTPLTIIRGYASLLGEKENISKEDKKLVGRINISVEQLHLLIGDILDVSRLQQGRLSFEKTDVQVKDVLEEIVDSLTPVAKEKNLELTYKEKVEEPLINVDIGRLKQTIINVVGNAVKYTLEGSINIKTYTKQDKLFIRISDTGIGMTEEEREHLFERFYRIKSKETQEIRGTGLGLWISKMMIEKMGGNISVESIKGKGSDFIITFPIAKD